MKLTHTSLSYEASLLKSRLMLAIGMLFADLQDDEHELHLGEHSFTIEDGREEVKDIFLSFDNGELKTLTAGVYIDREVDCTNYNIGEVDCTNYNIEEMFNIDYLLVLLKALESIKQERQIQTN